MSSSTTPALPAPATVDVFGPSNPLYPLLLLHLPDVLTRIVVHFASPLYPRHAQYTGNAVLRSGCHAAFNTRTAGLLASQASSRSDASALTSALSSARTFSLLGPLTVCGWMCRPRADKPGFLLSANTNSPHAVRSTVLFIGHDKHSSGEVQLCTRFGGEPTLCASHSITGPEPAVHGGWEFVAVTFQPAAADIDEAMEAELEDDEDEGEPTSGTRRLYHNGSIVAEDECSPALLGTDFHLLIGRYDTRPMSSFAQGGLCDVRVYSRALDADEVRGLYEGQEVSSEQLEVRWRLDGSQLGEDRYVRDSSGHNRHAVLPGLPVEISMTGSPINDAVAAEEGVADDTEAEQSVR